MKAKALLTPPDAGRRNKTEEAFWQMQLIRKRAGEIHDCLWEPLNLRLADNTYYKPDCIVIEKDGTITIFETKGGFTREDSRVKVKVAAQQFYWLRFIVAKRTRGQWHYEPINAR